MIARIPLGETVLSILALATKTNKGGHFLYKETFSALEKILPNLSLVANKFNLEQRLEDIFFRLGHCDAISISSPYFDKVTVNPRVWMTIEEDVKRDYGDSALVTLEEAADEFLEQIQ